LDFIAPTLRWRKTSARETPHGAVEIHLAGALKCRAVMTQAPVTVLQRLVATAVLFGLASAAVAALVYFRAENGVQRLTGWTVPANATLIDEKVESSPFGTHREYLFEVPPTEHSDQAWCELLRLPLADPGHSDGADNARLSGKAVCEWVHSASFREGFSITASRRRIAFHFWLI
jgi:hypothetical protein